MSEPLWSEPVEFDEGWIQMVGDYVAIRSNREHSEKYIDFVAVRGDGDDCWIDEDSPVDGGMSLQFARQIRDELSLAIEVLKAVELCEICHKKPAIRTVIGGCHCCEDCE